ncbi:DUF6472 family protein [Lachnoclostridium sp. Marseille-P6806]|uniref:DUF6472 family protein n=1 Tax=Lachnoclostridium sp. Marseille-P6806 TaxID=2364793 RepID=UPI00102F946C|nr:DUF6472 family protein [Lachnoclostridium sp. Marseille-P6806]
MRDKKLPAVSCDFCCFNEYDEEDDSWSCSVNMDEDDQYRFLTQRGFSCPYYRSGDEYEVVRHQM